MIKITSKQAGYRKHCKRYCCLFFITLSLLLKPDTGHTAFSEYQIQIEFFFDTQMIADTLNKQVSGYRLYMEGLPVCETAEVEPQLQSFSCTVVSKYDTCTFTLSALYDDNSVSPQSDPFFFTPVLRGDINADGVVDLRDVIIGLQVLTNINITPTELVKAGDVNNDGKIGLAEVLYCLGKV